VSGNALSVNGPAFTSETASLTVSLTLTDDERVTLAAAERNDVTYLSAAPLALTVNFDSVAKTITRVSGAGLSSLSVGDFIQILDASANATDGQQFYRIQSIAGDVITLVGDPAVALQLAASEILVQVGIAPVVLDPKANAASAVNGLSDTITLSAPHGYVTGSKVKYGNGGNAGIVLEGGGTLANDGTYYVIRVDGTSVKLAASYAAALAGTPIDLADAPLPEEEGKAEHSLSSSSFIVVAHQSDRGRGHRRERAVDADAGAQIYLGSESSILVDRIEAGNDTTGAEARIKAGADILRAGSTDVIRAGDLVLEAGAGTIGQSGNVILINLVGNGTLTARARTRTCISPKPPARCGSGPCSRTAAARICPPRAVRSSTAWTTSSPTSRPT
jgi:hypothetical protein